jgi:SAM-dependent methyltransferase
MPQILDPCCGPRSMWFNPHHPDVIYGDQRSETVTVTDRSHGKQDGQRVLHIEPDAIMDFRALPFPDNSFALVAFDPPHIKRAGPRSWIAARYGKLSDTWQDDLAAGFRECFRVLRPDGTLVFKWNETQLRLSEILPLSPYPPLFGQVSGRQGMTHWLVFMQPPNDKAQLAGIDPVPK